jgi:Mn-dependent DtxR family transcriptional regulator
MFLEEKKLVKESSEGYCTLTEEGRKLYLDLRRSLPSIL